MCTSEENGDTNEAIVFKWLVSIALGDFEVVKKQWAGAVLSVNATVLCENYHERITQFLN